MKIYDLFYYIFISMTSAVYWPRANMRFTGYETRPAKTNKTSADEVMKKVVTSFLLLILQKNQTEEATK